MEEDRAKSLTTRPLTTERFDDFADVDETDAVARGLPHLVMRRTG
ncbi:hypothetical protein GCM10027418_01740 [Mariniluteicoccus endophyticus]